MIFIETNDEFVKDSISSAIRQKDESQNGCYKKAKHAEFSEKQAFLTPVTYTHVCVSRGKNVHLSEILTWFVFL